MCGLRIGLAFVAVTVAALAGVAEHAAEIGLALALLLLDGAPILTTPAACGGDS